MNKTILYLVLLFLFSSCGQNNKSIENSNTKILFEEIKPIQENLNSNIQIKLSKFVKNNSFINICIIIKN